MYSWGDALHVFFDPVGYGIVMRHLDGQCICYSPSAREVFLAVLSHPECIA